MCQVKASKKCRVRANTVDHIVRPEEGGAEYDEANLRASCRSCNMVRHNARYFREKVDATAAGHSVPTESPRLIPERRSGRPRAGDDKYIGWAMSLHGVSGEPTDHKHSRWATPIMLFTRRGAFHVCPDTCPSPVRWP